MQYLRYTYLFPPRPDQAISPDSLPMLEQRGFIAQIKKNGTCNVIAVSPEGEITVKSRHGDDHKAWVPQREKLSAFTALKGRGWYVFVAELLHSKVTGIRDINYVHDVLVADGKYLLGKSQRDRQMILRSIFDVSEITPTYSHYVYDAHTWIAREYTQGFVSLFNSLTRDEDEGLVLKNPGQPLALCVREKSNNAGMLKARRHNKKYTF